MTINTNKAPEFLLAGEILQLYDHDCLVSSKAKYAPFPLLEQILVAYSNFLGVRAPSSKQLGAYLSSKYPKQTNPQGTFYQVGIKPDILPRDTE